MNFDYWVKQARRYSVASNWESGIYVYMDIRISFLYFDPRVFVFAWWSTSSPYSTQWNPLVYQSLPVSSIVYPFELGCVWHTWFFFFGCSYVLRTFLKLSIQISGSGKLSWVFNVLFVIVLALHNSIVLTWKFIV